MKNYLSRLVERHFAEPAIRPRTLSRFEPGGWNGAERDADTPAAGAAQAAPVTRPAEQAASMRAPRQAPAQGHQDGRDAGRSDHARPRKAADGVATPHTVKPAAAAGMQQKIHEEVAPVAVIPAPAEQPSPIITVAPNERDAERSVPAQHLQPAGPNTPANSRAEQLGQAAPARPVPMPKGAPVAPPPTGSAASPDIVRVHIGRIEVRAVTAPGAGAARAPRAAVQPPLSLDGYLKGKA